MNILQVVPDYYPVVGGVERHVQALSEALAQHGHNVVVAAAAPANKSPWRSQMNGVTVLRFPTLGPRAYRAPLGLAQYLARHHHTFDVIHAHNYHALPLLAAALIGGQRTVVSPYLHALAHSRIAQLLHHAYGPLAAYALKQVSGMVCLSSGEAALCMQKLGVPPDRITVIPSGVASLESRPKGQRERIILSVGRLERYKRVDRVIAALPYLAPDITCIVVGAGPEQATLMQLAARLNVQARVRFEGQVADAALRSWYQRAAVVVSCSEAESFGLTILEALNAGCSVVCNAIPAFRDFRAAFPDAVSCVAPTDAHQQVATCLQAALDRPQPARLDLQRYTWPTIVQQVTAVYESIARSTGVVANQPCASPVDVTPRVLS